MTEERNFIEGTRSAAALFAAEVSNYKPYTNEKNKEETRIFRDQSKPLNERMQARERLVKHNLRLVLDSMNHFTIPAPYWMDAAQEAIIGLLRGIEGFDPDRDIAFSTYVSFWIRAPLYTMIQNGFRIVRCHTGELEKKVLYHLSKIESSFRCKGIVPTDELVAKELGIPIEVVRHQREVMNGQDIFIDDEEELSILASSQEDKIMEKSEILDAIDDFRNSLPENKKSVFDVRILEKENITLERLGIRLGVSKQRVAQIEVQLRQQLEEKLKRWKSLHFKL